MSKNKKGGKIKLWIINASPREKNNCPQEKSKSQRIAEYIFKIAKKEGDEIYLTNLYEYPPIGPCKGCVSTVMSLCHYPCDCYPDIKYPEDPMQEFYKIGERVDGIIFVTPVHWWSFSSYLSLFLGRLCCVDGGRKNANNKDKKFEINLIKSGKFKSKKHWAGKIAGIYTISESTTGAAEPLAMTLNWMGFWIPPYCISEEIVGNEVQYHDHQKALDKNSCSWDSARYLILNVIEAIKIIKGRKLNPINAKCLR
ncbi:MAG: flavodoxin family protein [Nanoarchaeota archaeon]